MPRCEGRGTRDDRPGGRDAAPCGRCVGSEAGGQLGRDRSMNAFRTFACVLSIAAIAAAAATASWPARAAVVWQDAGSLEVEGMGWADAAPFRRLPGSAKVKVNQTAWDQSGDSAGIAVRFVTDAAEVSVRWSLTNASLAMPHMPATGCSGLDLYAREAGGEWRFVGNCRPGKQDGNLANVPFADGATRAGMPALSAALQRH